MRFVIRKSKQLLVHWLVCLRIPSETYLKRTAVYIRFTVEDYEAPVATWDARIDYSYMYVAYRDDQYVRTITSGISGQSLTNIPTSSHFWVNFNESSMVYDVVGETWRDLNYTIFNPQILADALTVRNESDNRELVYGVDYWVEYIYLSGNKSFRIIITDDYSHLGYGNDFLQPYWLGSMKSNSSYSIKLNADMISDVASCGNTGNLIEDIPLVSWTTRDDTPPVLTIKDAKGAVVCDETCADNNFFINVNQPWYDVDDWNTWLQLYYPTGHSWRRHYLLQLRRAG
jgi:hypothetical protein